MRKASDALELCPALYCQIMTMRLGRKKAFNRVVHPQTDITIEGFPRCANSFAVQAFRSVNDSDQKHRIATHLHSPANVLESIRLDVPTVVLIRKPEDALVSWLSLAVQLNKVNQVSQEAANQRKRMIYWTQRYASFYEQLMPVRSKMLCLDFTDVVSDFGACIERINQRFKTNFQLFDHTDAGVEAVFAKSKVHLSPSTERERIKDTIREVYISEENQANRERACSVYRQFLNES